MRAIVEHTHADARSIARVLTARGETAVLEEPEALDLRLPPHDAYYADPWTPEVAPRIRASRRAGVAIFVRAVKQDTRFPSAPGRRLRTGLRVVRARRTLG